MGYIMEREELRSLLDSENIRVCDCRFMLGAPDKGRELYEKEHISGAIYFDLERDLSGQVEEHGGRHPLPNLDQLKVKLESHGITNETILVAYDGGEGSFASRFAWLLTYVGHQEVYILNGGYQSWKESGYPCDNRIPHFAPSHYQLQIKDSVLATYQDVLDFTEKRPDDIILVDSRESKRFLGIEEPIDKKAGHIPGAINKLWTDVLDAGFFLQAGMLKQTFKDLPSDKEIIVYCGSGVTATPNFIALKEAGYPNVSVYVGSFSDWISYPDNPVG